MILTNFYTFITYFRFFDYGTFFSRIFLVLFEPDQMSRSRFLRLNVNFRICGFIVSFGETREVFFLTLNLASVHYWCEHFEVWLFFIF